MNTKGTAVVKSGVQLTGSVIGMPAIVGTGALVTWVISLLFHELGLLPFDTSIMAVVGAAAGTVIGPRLMAREFITAIAKRCVPRKYSEYPMLYEKEIKEIVRGYRKKVNPRGQMLGLLLRKTVEIPLPHREVKESGGTRQTVIRISGDVVSEVEYFIPSELSLWRDAVRNAMELE